MPTEFLSRTMVADINLTFSAGTLQDVIRMSLGDFLHLVEPKVSDFSQYMERATPNRDTI